MGDLMKTITAIAAVALLALAAPASGAGSERQVTEEYQLGSGAFVGHGEVHWTIGSRYVKFRALDDERLVTLAAEDSTGQPVRAHVHIDRDGDGKLDKQVDFCGSTARPLAVQSGSIIEVGTIVTEGTITATFTK
jgi:hypothetical protein